MIVILANMDYRWETHKVLPATTLCYMNVTPVASQSV